MQSETGKQRRENKHDEDDAGSVYSYNSTRDVSNFVKELHGRIFNNLNESYLLPSDQPEWVRLDKQGSALAIAFDGLYPCRELVEAVLQPVEGGPQKKILDLGCGTGAWAMQMAIKFPHAAVLGVDVAPTPMDQSMFPPNLSLEIDDITLGLSHFAGQYDLVHMRCVSAGLNDIHKTMEDVQLCLKPGGMVLIVDGEITMPAEDRFKMVPFKRMPGDGTETNVVSDEGSSFRRLIWEACEACEIAGADLTRSYDFNDRGLWESPLCDPETCRSGGVDLPIGPWATSPDPGETQLLQYVGLLMRQNILSINFAYHAILRKHGMTQETLDQWAENVTRELEECNPKQWVRFRFYLGRRRAGPNLPAPPLPDLPEPVAQTTTRSRYPAYDLYTTKEENDARMRLRHSCYGIYPPSVLRRAYQEMLDRDGVPGAST